MLDILQKFKSSIKSVFDFDKDKISSTNSATSLGWSVAEMPKTNFNVFAPVGTKETPIMTNPSKPKPAAPMVDPSKNFLERLTSKDTPVFWATPTIRKQYSDAWYQETKVQDLFDTFNRSFSDLLVSGKQAYLWPISNTLWQVGIMSPETIKKNEASYQKWKDKQAQNAINSPYLEERPEWKVWISEAFKTWVAKDPWYWANIISQTAWQLAATVPAAVVWSAAGWPIWWALGMWAMFYWPSVQWVYEDLQNSKVDNDIAAPVSMAIWLPIAALDMIADRLQLSKVPWFKTLFSKIKKEATQEAVSFAIKQLSTKKMVWQSVKDFLVTVNTEGMTEVAQQALQNATVKYFDWSRDLFEWALDSYVMWVVWSSPFWTMWWIGKYIELWEQNKQAWMMDEARTQAANNIAWAENSYSPMSNIDPTFNQKNTTQKLISIDNRLQEITTEHGEEFSTMPLNIKEESVLLQREKDDLLWIQEAKYQQYDELIEDLPDKQPIIQPAQEYKWPEQFTSKMLEDLKGKTTIAKQYIQDFMNRADVKQAEKNIIKDVLTKFDGKKINVAEFGKKMEDRLFKIVAETGWRKRESYGDSEKIFEEHPDVQDYQYDEAVYTMPYQANPW